MSKKLKGTVHFKIKKFCHHLLTLKLFQTCKNLFLLLKKMEDILKTVGNQTDPI